MNINIDKSSARLKKTVPTSSYLSVGVVRMTTEKRRREWDNYFR